MTFNNGPSRELLCSTLSNKPSPSDKKLHSCLKEAVSMNTVQIHAEKAIVRTPGPQEFSQWLRAYKLKLKELEKGEEEEEEDKGDTKEDKSKWEFDKLIEFLAHRRKWSTTSRRAAAALRVPVVAMPTTTLETTADPLSISRHRFPNHRLLVPMMWQYSSEPQYAPPTFSKKIDTFTLPKIQPPEVKNANSMLETIPETALTSLPISSLNARRVFLRPIPGYGGYCPRFPVPLAENDSDLMPFSTAQDTYRGYPGSVYQRSPHTHRSPLSRVVTLTSPYNPFNQLHPSANRVLEKE